MAISPKKLAELFVKALDDAKATEIQLLDVRKLTTMTDYMIIATGRSSRQVKALSDHVLEAGLKKKLKPLGVEGEQAAEWILIDFGDVIVHAMQAETRAFYQLEKLWGFPPAAPVAP
jgi:ribosome-associated protein